LYGATGDDHFEIFNASTKIVEPAGAGHAVADVYSSSYVLPVNVSNIWIGTTSGASVTGNGAGNIIVDNTGNDTIDSGGGHALLTGGGGNDTFVFKSLGYEGSIITDFSVGHDHLALHQALTAIGYTGSTAVADGYLSFVQHGTDTQVILDATGHNTGTEHVLVTLQHILATSLTQGSDYLV
jgi:Ca2+-binding RTX toxin-like protein